VAKKQTEKMAQTAFKDKMLADLYLQGEVSLDEIDDFVDAWHQGGTGLPLSAFLGLSRAECARWVEEPESLEAALNGPQPRNPEKRLYTFTDRMYLIVRKDWSD